MESQEPTDKLGLNLKLQRQLENCTQPQPATERSPSLYPLWRSSKSHGIIALRENSTSGNFMEQQPQSSPPWANNLQHFRACCSAAWEPCSKSHVIQNSGGHVDVQLPFSQELPRSPASGRTPALGRHRPGARLRPQDIEEGPRSLPLDFEVQRYRRNRSPQGLRQTGRHRERFRDPGRQSHSRGKRAKVSGAMEILSGIFRNERGNLGGLRSARRKLAQQEFNS